MLNIHFNSPRWKAVYFYRNISYEFYFYYIFYAIDCSINYGNTEILENYVALHVSLDDEKKNVTSLIKHSSHSESGLFYVRNYISSAVRRAATVERLFVLVVSRNIYKRMMRILREAMYILTYVIFYVTFKSTNLRGVEEKCRSERALQTRP